MADFRKWSMAIAVVLLAAATANAQQSFTMPCSLTSNTELIRVGGLTERLANWIWLATPAPCRPSALS